LIQGLSLDNKMSQDFPGCCEVFLCAHIQEDVKKKNPTKLGLTERNVDSHQKQNLQSDIFGNAVL